MKKLSIIFTILMSLALVLAACSTGQDTDGSGAVLTPELGSGTAELPDTGIDETVEPGLDVTPMETMDLGNETPAVTENMTAATEEITATETLSETPMITETPVTIEPAETVTDTGTTTDTVRGAQILPETGQQELIRLSNWMGFTIADQNDQPIGQVQDYIVNTCEAHIVYMVVQPDAGLALEGGNEFLIPYEAVSVNNGTLNADTRTMTINIDASQLSGIPALDQRPDLATTDWETEVRDFWSGVVDLSNLDTSCAVAPASDSADTESVNVYKIAYASNLLSANLQDGNANALGQVQEALVQPQSGQIFYLVVNRVDGGTVLVPMRAVNIPESGNLQDGTLNLELLVENTVLQDAPAIDSIESLADYMNADANNYWSQFVPMNQGQ